jgi:hypothetical protein
MLITYIAYFIETCRFVNFLSTCLLQNPIKGPNDPYDPHNFDDVFSIQYGGFGEPRGGYDGPGEQSKVQGFSLRRDNTRGFTVYEIGITQLLNCRSGWISRW